MLLTRVVRAALSYGWDAVGTGLGLLSKATPNDRAPGHDVSTTAAQTAESPVQPPSTDKSETVDFGLDGQAYEIDLSADEARRMRATLQRYVDAGRPVTNATPPTTANGWAGKATPAEHHGEAAAIREWARAHGHQVSDRGRIPARVLNAYRAAG